MLGTYMRLQWNLSNPNPFEPEEMFGLQSCSYNKGYLTVWSVKKNRTQDRGKSSVKTAFRIRRLRIRRVPLYWVFERLLKELAVTFIQQYPYIAKQKMFQK